MAKTIKQLQRELVALRRKESIRLSKEKLKLEKIQVKGNIRKLRRAGFVRVVKKGVKAAQKFDAARKQVAAYVGKGHRVGKKRAKKQLSRIRRYDPTAPSESWIW